MEITIKRTVYKQSGMDLKFYYETQNEFQTNKYSYDDPIFARENLLKDFKKRKLLRGDDEVSEMELYLDGVLVADVEPYFTVGDETFISWFDCCLANDDITIGETTITKKLNIVNWYGILEVLNSNYIETFSE